MLGALPDPLCGTPAQWLPAGLPASDRALLSKAVPDGPRGVVLALEAFAVLVDRLGGNAGDFSELVEGVRGLRHAKMEPTATDQPLSHFVYITPRPSARASISGQCGPYRRCGQLGRRRQPRWQQNGRCA